MVNEQENKNQDNIMNTAFDKEQFRKNRDNITNTAFDEFNRTAFQGQLGKDVAVQWPKRLRTTAGLTWLTFSDDTTPGFPRK